MALQKDFSSPYSTSVLPNAYYRIVETNLNYADEVGQITVHVYESKAARDAGKLPVGSVAIPLTKAGKPPTDDEGNVVYKQEDGTYKNGSGQTVVPAYYGLPDFATLMNNAVVPPDTPPYTKVFDIAKAMLYTLMKTQPDFAGATDIE